MKRLPWERPEAMLQARAEKILRAAGIKFTSNHRLPNEFEPLYIDTLIFKDGKPFIVVEYKKEARSQDLMLALGQCLTYTHLLGLDRSQYEFKAIICTPNGTLSRVEDAAYKFGVTVCDPENLPRHIGWASDPVPEQPVARVLWPERFA